MILWWWKKGERRKQTVWDDFIGQQFDLEMGGVWWYVIFCCVVQCNVM